MSVKKFAADNKGVTLVLVIVVLMVVAILANILIEAAVQSYRLGKSSGSTDYSYYAGENAIQKTCDILYAKCSSASLANEYHIIYSNDEQFAKAMVNVALKPYIEQLSLENCFKDMDVGDDAGNTADVSIKLEYLGYERNESVYPGKIEIKIGITAQSNYTVKPFLSGDKKVYAIKKFRVSIPDQFKLRGPVYTIGDLMADNGAVVDILGDVHVYGTSPEFLKQPEQYYYGGIYAKHNSTMSIRGNAYSRSFIRTGRYTDTAVDSSSIYVYKDAVAQCLQIFGRGQRIGVMGNAYTFDDLEINGEDSVLAINGSYFGLSNGTDGHYHDNSSAIVNSATLHHFYSPESQRSRIVVNGAVMLSGGTFRTTEDGASLYQIEDASLAWVTDPLSPSPVYKKADPLPAGTSYIDWLKVNYESVAKGFGNLFQVFPQMAGWNMDPGSTVVGDNFNDWFNRIDVMRSGGSSNTGISAIKPDKIKGFSFYVMAANDGLYFMDKNSESSSGLARADQLANSFSMDNVEPPDALADWSNYWNPYVDVSYTGQESYAWNGSYCTKIPLILNDILKPKLLYETSVFVDRNVKDANVKSGTAAVLHQSKDVFNKLEDAISNLLLNTPSNPYILSVYDTSDGVNDGKVNLSYAGFLFNDIAAYPWAAGQSFLIVNTNPELDLVLDGTEFNGILFTNGKVILKEGSRVNGAIIAAGRGYDDSSVNGYVNGSAAETGIVDGKTVMTRVPRIKEYGSSGNTNIAALDNGSYAAVYCSGAGVDIHFPHPDPDTGRKMLLDKFKDQDPAYPIDLYNIF